MKNCPVMLKLKSVFRKLSVMMDATTSIGRRTRFWIAVIFSIAAISVDSFMIWSNYDYLPARVGVLHDWDGVPQEWGDKSLFIRYCIERALIFILWVSAGWTLLHFKRESVIVKRFVVLLLEIAMLAVTTCVGISIAVMQSSLGVKDASVSEHYEYIVMSFWVVIMVAEFVSDILKLKKGNKTKEYGNN